MENLDLHGKSYDEAEFLVLTFIENNLDNLPIQIITGNSANMKNIVFLVAKKHNLRTYTKSDYNLGCLIIDIIKK